ncbi:MAG: hypothetical protein KGZ88_06115 [Methylomicrobium sp.]|nr:hypothetical protein [Methylomicrobium sp.]
MKTTISMDNSVPEQLLAFTQSKTAKESVSKASEEYLRFKKREELLACRGSVEMDDNSLALRNLETRLF